MATASGLAGWFNGQSTLTHTGQTSTDVARWYEAEPAASFAWEAPGVLLAALPLHKGAPTRIDWADTNTAVIELRARPDRPVMSKLHIAEQTASFFASPFAEQTVTTLTFAAHAPKRSTLSGRYLGLARSEQQSYTVLFAANLQQPGSEPNIVFEKLGVETIGGLDPDRVVAAAVHPDGERVALAVKDEDGQTSLAEYALSEEGTAPVQRGPAGDRITTVQYDAAGQRLLYLRRDRDNIDTLCVAIEDVERELAYGRLILSAHAFRPDGEAVVYARFKNDKTAVIEMTELAIDAEPISVGEGWAAAWHPSGRFLVASANDRKGHAQVWAIDIRPPHGRDQLTHLDGGTARSVSISPDGAWAASTLAGDDKSALVFADLSGVEF
jgi:WD40 repeat protein